MLAIWETLMGGLKDERISIGIMGVLLGIVYYAHAWANDEHKNLVGKGDFDKLMTLMVTHTEEFSIVTASQLIRDKELQLELATATGKSAGEVSRIQTEIQAAKLYRTCLIDQKPNCKHLKPPE